MQDLAEIDWSAPRRMGRTAGDGVRVNFPDRMSLLSDLRRLLRERKGFAVATLNLDHVVKLRRSAAFRKAYKQQSHVVADGNPVVWLSRLSGRRIDLVAGSDLVLPLAALAAEERVPVALVGSTTASLEGARAALVAIHPNLEVTECVAPPFGFDPEGPDADALLEALSASGARMCFLALGAPKQEILAARGRQLLPQMGFASIGAGLDFLSGTQTRAPAVVRAIAMEWLWRLASSPRRLAGRYAACSAILPRLTVEALRARMKRAGGT